MCMCACAHKCVRPRACERGIVCVCDVAHVDMGKRAHVCAPLHVPVCAVVCGMVCARGDTRQMQARPAASRILTASPVYESSEGGEESAYGARMSLQHLSATFRAARAHARRACRQPAEHRMHAEHQITAASRRRQARLASLCNPCICSSLGGGRRWRRPHSPRTCSSLACARRWRCPRSPCMSSCVGALAGPTRPLWALLCCALLRSSTAWSRNESPAVE